jgi:hypothetical protein
VYLKLARYDGQCAAGLISRNRFCHEDICHFANHFATGDIVHVQMAKHGRSVDGEQPSKVIDGGAVDDENHGNSPESIIAIPHLLRAAVGQ